MAMNTIIVKWVWANTVAAPKAMPSAEEDKNSHLDTHLCLFYLFNIEFATLV